MTTVPSSPPPPATDPVSGPSVPARLRIVAWMLFVVALGLTSMIVSVRSTLMADISRSANADVTHEVKELQNFAATPGVDGASIIGLEGAIPILLGDNLGTTITALLAAIGQSRDAKRVALSHCIFNLSGCLLFVWLIGPAAAVVAAISPAGPEVEVIARQIANAHTLFNVTMTVLWLPLVSVMVKIVMAILPEKPRRPRDPLADTLETPLAPDAAAA